MATVKLIGMDKLQATLKRYSGPPDLAKTVIKKNGNQLNARMKEPTRDAYVQG